MRGGHQAVPDEIFDVFLSDSLNGELLDKHEREVDEVGKAVMAGKRDDAVAGLAGLATSILTGVPGLGGLVTAGLTRVFANPANSVLESQIDAWNKEQDARRRLADITDVIEALLGQTLLQVVHVQQAVKEELIAALGGLRDDLAGFRTDVERGMIEAGVRVELQEVGEAGVGVRVRDRARERVLIDRPVVRGRGTIGIVIG